MQHLANLVEREADDVNQMHRPALFQPPHRPFVRQVAVARLIPLGINRLKALGQRDFVLVF
jgi:hypothetical protein